MATVCENVTNVQADSANEITVVGLVRDIDRLSQVKTELHALYLEQVDLERAISRFCDLDPELAGWKKEQVSFRVDNRVIRVKKGICSPEITIETLPSKIIQ